ncbi:MAG: GGDEF domain-containing protein [Hyphomicrobiales bacterium]|nr:GGDEF domain-containing protein [Hyphomicrobiales bacterium]
MRLRRLGHAGLDLAASVRTNADVVRWTAIRTILAVALVVPATALAVWWLHGGDLGRPRDGYDGMRFALVLCALEALVFGPVLAWRTGMTLKALNLARDELDRLARVDPLTGLFNRRGFDQAAAVALDWPQAWGRPAAIVMGDLDHFKSVNDRFGHEFGDVALKRVAEVLRSAAGDRPILLGRQGGEEFLLLLTGLTRAEASAFADGIRRAIAAEPVEWDGMRATVTMSFGVAAVAAYEGRISRLIARADAALLEAKRAGRNCVVELAEALAAA